MFGRLSAPTIETNLEFLELYKKEEKAHKTNKFIIMVFAKNKKNSWRKVVTSLII